MIHLDTFFLILITEVHVLVSEKFCPLLTFHCAAVLHVHVHVCINHCTTCTCTCILHVHVVVLVFLNFLLMFYVYVICGLLFSHCLLY